MSHPKNTIFYPDHIYQLNFKLKLYLLQAHYIGEVPLEIHEFIVKTPRVAGSLWTEQCPKCGGQKKLVESRALNSFWRCMAFPYCKSTKSLDNISKKPSPIPSKYSPKHRLSSEQELDEFAKIALHELKTRQQATQWLITPKIALGGKRPCDMLEFANDLKKIRELLLKLNN